MSGWCLGGDSGTGWQVWSQTRLAAASLSYPAPSCPHPSPLQGTITFPGHFSVTARDLIRKLLQVWVDGVWVGVGVGVGGCCDLTTSCCRCVCGTEVERWVGDGWRPGAVCMCMLSLRAGGQLPCPP